MSGQDGCVRGVPHRLFPTRPRRKQGKSGPARANWSRTDPISPIVRGGRAGIRAVESGLSYEGEAQDGLHSRVLTVPGALARIGLWPRTELRIGGDGFLSNTVGDVRTSGQSDIEIGDQGPLVRSAIVRHRPGGDPDGVAADRCERLHVGRRRSDVEGDLGARAGRGLRPHRQLQHRRR